MRENRLTGGRCLVSPPGASYARPPASRLPWRRAVYLQIRKAFARTLRYAALTALFFGGSPFLQPTAIAAGATPAPAKGTRVLPASAAAPIDFPTIAERYG